LGKGGKGKRTTHTTHRKKDQYTIFTPFPFSLFVHYLNGLGHHHGHVTYPATQPQDRVSGTRRLRPRSSSSGHGSFLCTHDIELRATQALLAIPHGLVDPVPTQVLALVLAHARLERVGEHLAHALQGLGKNESLVYRGVGELGCGA